MTIDTKPWDVAEVLDTPEAIAAYLDAALEENDPAFFSKALGDAARAIGMTKIAQDAGITREALYKALSERGNPTLDTLFKVLKALGVRISVHA
jgi:probable addiction module antidote protein